MSTNDAEGIMALVSLMVLSAILSFLNGFFIYLALSPFIDITYWSAVGMGYLSLFIFLVGLASSNLGKEMVSKVVSNV